jgi:hypothetical protein
MKEYPKISLCMTTSRRFNLWFRTIKSFITNCLDKDLIYETIIVDDRSSNEDLIKMQQMLCKYQLPRINIISNQEYGQLNSIKMLYNITEMKYVLHLEDDWSFLIRDNFIRKSFDIMFSDRRIKQVTFRYWECVYVKDDDIEYRIHHYSPLPLKEWDIIKYNDCTYYGLSFNPGIVYKKIVQDCIKNVIQQDPENRTWDKEVSKNFWDLGYKRANLCEEYITHIGKESYYKRNN